METTIRDEKPFEFLIRDLINNNHTMVQEEHFLTVLRNSEKIQSLEGDVVECGCWRGGFSIFLNRLFPEKHTWAVDSFEGFQPLHEATYIFNEERHNDGLFKLQMTLDPDSVRKTFSAYECENYTIIKGFVKDALKPEKFPVEKIALLRIDVDSYSATRETLDLLYSKVVKGGYIIFDDSELWESNKAVTDFFTEKGIEFQFMNPYTDEVCTNLPDHKNGQGGWRVNYPWGYLYDEQLMPKGMYIIKQ
jgi:hypothetical protein